MKRDTNVKCDVDACKYNDCHYCNLKTLDISCTCDGSDCNDKKETICRSFVKR